MSLQDLTLDTVVLGNPITAWLVALAFVALGLVLGRVLGWSLERAGHRSGRPVAVQATAQLRPAVSALGAVLGLRFAIGSLRLSEAAHDLAAVSAQVAAIGVGTWGAARVYAVIHERVVTPYAQRPDTGLDLQLVSALGSVARAAIWLLGVGSALSSAGFDIDAILAGFGVGGLAMALAAQDTVANLFGGVLVLTQRPFVIGDRVKVAGEDGWVQEIGLRTTRIVNWYGRNIYLPNKVFTGNAIENIDSQKCYFVEVWLRLRYDMSPDQIEQAMQIVREVIAEIDIIGDDIWLGYDRIEDGAHLLELWYPVPLWAPEEKGRFMDWYSKQSAAKTQFNLALTRRFAAAGVKLALPVEARVQGATTEGSVF